MFRHQCPHPYHQMESRRFIERWGLVLVIVGLVLFFVFGRMSVKNVDDYQLENEAQHATITKLSGENKELLKQQDFAENSKKIDAQATIESRRSLTKLHDELSGVKEQLAFYQRVVAPETIVKGLYINNFEITRSDMSSAFRYQLILAQGDSQKRAIKGKYTLSIMGLLQGQEKTLSLVEVLLDKAQTMSFSFRYYEILAGGFELPKDFLPTAIKLVIKPSRKGAKQVVQLLQWKETIVNQ
ncbi:MAG: hypothetical protein JKX87_01375 [Cycloclasticus sp.]|nr:hypothetical protein [Cycloclasticus sp.]